jgi:hypothetical protein
MNKRKLAWLLVPLLFIVIIILAIPSVRLKLVNRMDQARIFIRYSLFPPEDYVFTPEGKSVFTPSIPATIILTSASVTPSPEIITLATPTPTITSTPTQTTTPLPGKVILEGVRYQDQHGLWNYCAPANLAMALSYWGINRDRQVVGKVLKPLQDDKNVMPYEMLSYVQTQTDLTGVIRYGGTVELLKTFVANKFPVLIEKGVYSPASWVPEGWKSKIVWMGHYNLVVGYDDVLHSLIVRDSYYSPPKYPLDYQISYDEIIKQWSGFNYTFFVIYPKDQKEKVFTLLGDYLDETKNFETALQKDHDAAASLEGLDKFFALFNVGSTYVYLRNYSEATYAYDQAFQLLAQMPKEQRPYRMMWYQTGPYFAYFYTGRYQDVVDLATTTLNAVDKPYLEESWYWRGMAKIALGDQAGGIADLRAALDHHPGFLPAIEALKTQGITVNP